MLDALKEILAESFIAIAATVAGIAWLIGIVIVKGSDNAWVYQPLLSLLVLLPSLGFFVFAVVGRTSPATDRVDKVANKIGSAGCIFAGLLLLASYSWLLWSKLS